MNIDRTAADYMGMLATVINALAVSESLISEGVDAVVLTSLAITGVGEPFNFKNADKYLKEGKIVVFGGGTGNPYFSTDTCASLRAVEIGPNAKKFDEISYDEYVSLGLKAMDTSAVIMCKENGMKVHAFGLKEENSIMKAVTGDREGTVIY